MNIKRIRHLYKTYGMGWHYFIYTQKWALLTIGRDDPDYPDNRLQIILNLWFIHLNLGIGLRQMGIGE